MPNVHITLDSQQGATIVIELGPEEAKQLIDKVLAALFGRGMGSYLEVLDLESRFVKTFHEKLAELLERMAKLEKAGRGPEWWETLLAECYRGSPKEVARRLRLSVSYVFTARRFLNDLASCEKVMDEWIGSSRVVVFRCGNVYKVYQIREHSVAYITAERSVLRRKLLENKTLTRSLARAILERLGL